MYSKNVPEWKVHQEIFSHIQVIEMLGNICFSEQFVLQKIVAGCPCNIHNEIFFLSI